MTPEPMNSDFDSRAFYELMQAYRWSSNLNQSNVVDAFEAVKDYCKHANHAKQKKQSQTLNEIEATRPSFERWYSDDGKWSKSVERKESGSYKLTSCYLAWIAWEAAKADSAKPTEPQGANHDTRAN